MINILTLFISYRYIYNAITVKTGIRQGEVGFVPTILEKMAPSSENAIAVVCGPPIMIKMTFPVLEKAGFAADNIFTTLENRMKCGFGKCGRCNIGSTYVCKDGPVFTYTQLKNLPDEY